jgi:hypothetical protein
VAHAGSGEERLISAPAAGVNHLMAVKRLDASEIHCDVNVATAVAVIGEVEKAHSANLNATEP